jgi:hypothetical protein
MKWVMLAAMAVMLIGAGQSARDPIDPHFVRVGIGEFEFAEVKLAVVPPPSDSTKGRFGPDDRPALRDEKSCRMSQDQMAAAWDILKRVRVVDGARRRFDIDFDFVFVDPRGGLYSLDVGFPRAGDRGGARAYAGDYVGVLSQAEYRRAVQLATDTGCKP